MSLNEETAREVGQLFSFVQFENNTQLIRMGEKSDSMYLILKGIVRAFYIDENGVEITKCFAKENEWAGFYNYITDDLSPFFVETLEKTDCAVIKATDIRSLCQKMPALAQKVSTLVNQAFLQTDKKVYDFASKEAKERYINFAKENPEIINTPEHWRQIQHELFIFLNLACFCTVKTYSTRNNVCFCLHSQKRNERKIDISTATKVKSRIPVDTLERVSYFLSGCNVPAQITFYTATKSKRKCRNGTKRYDGYNRNNLLFHKNLRR